MIIAHIEGFVLGVIVTFWTCGVVYFGFIRRNFVFKRISDQFTNMEDAE